MTTPPEDRYTGTDGKFYPGDTVHIGNGKALYDIADAPFQQMADPGKTVLWSHDTGRNREVETGRIRLTKRGRIGKAADEDAQRKAEEIDAADKAKRQALVEHVQRRSGTAPGVVVVETENGAKWVNKTDPVAPEVTIEHGVNFMRAEFGDGSSVVLDTDEPAVLGVVPDDTPPCGETTDHSGCHPEDCEYARAATDSHSGCHPNDCENAPTATLYPGDIVRRHGQPTEYYVDRVSSHNPGTVHIVSISTQRKYAVARDRLMLVRRGENAPDTAASYPIDDGKRYPGDIVRLTRDGVDNVVNRVEVHHSETLHVTAVESGKERRIDARHSTLIKRGPNAPALPGITDTELPVADRVLEAVKVRLTSALRDLMKAQRRMKDVINDNATLLSIGASIETQTVSSDTRQVIMATETLLAVRHLAVLSGLMSDNEMTQFMTDTYEELNDRMAP